MPCAVAPITLAATILAAPMCPRLDRAPVPTMELVLAALRSDAPPAATAGTDPAFAAAIRAIKPAESVRPAKRRRTRR